MAPRKMFEHALEGLREDVIKMGTEVEQMIQKTIQAIVTHDETLAQEVIAHDDAIDKMEVEIEQQCIQIISKEQPVARDLRLVMSILKIITDMERIADHCEDICTYSIKIHDGEWSHEESYKRHIEKMANNVQNMFAVTMDSFMQKDADKIKEICKYDDKIDEAFDKIWREIIAEMKGSEGFIKSGARYMMIIKYLERMADHTTNIAESLVYNLTGEYAIKYKVK